MGNSQYFFLEAKWSDIKPISQYVYERGYILYPVEFQNENINAQA